ncbi:hypothetical protein X941_5516 [Burkholderia pseudomallei MSHR5569]|nr:hypothetical protein X941_5516 [Burkholderia pseudomallei MSHR5569]
MADAAASTSRDARGDRHRRCPTAGQGARPPRGARVRAKKTPAVGDGGRFVASAGLARPNAGDAGRRYSCAPVAPPCAADHSAGACRNFSTSSSVFVSK